MRRDDAFDEDQDPYPLDPEASRNALTGAIQGQGQRITDPPMTPAAPVTSNTDPRLSDPQHATDPNTLSFINNGYGSNTVNGPAPTAAPSPSDPTLSAIDALYKQYGIADGGSGSGFADRAYWAAHPSEVSNGRLAADLAGTGTDQPDGTPGTGPWQNSGRQARSAASPSASAIQAPAARAVPTAGAVNPGALHPGTGSTEAEWAISKVLSGEWTPEQQDAYLNGGAATPAPDATAGFNQQLRDLMLSQLKELSAPESADSPDIAPVLSAYNNQSQRDQQGERDALAERFYAGSDGGNALQSGGFNTSVQQGMESAAGRRANFAGSTVFQASQAKRQQLQAMLQTATNAGLTDAAQQIQAKIAAVDADIRRQGLNQQNSQFGQSLAQQNSQFGDSLGLSYAQILAQQNRDALLAGLG